MDDGGHTMARRLTNEEALKHFRAAAFSTARPDRVRTEAAITTLYEGAGLSAPRVVWGASPQATCLAADEVVGPIFCTTLRGDRIPANWRPETIEDEVTHIVLPWIRTRKAWNEEVTPQNHSSFEAYPEDLWRIIGFGHGMRLHPAHIGSSGRWDTTSVREQWAMIRFVENVGWWRLHRTHAFISERPTSISLDHQNRPHNVTGPAVMFRDRWPLYAVDGIRLPWWTVEEPNRITSSDIDEIANAELRRVLVTLSGDRYIEDRGSQIHADGWGELWEVPRTGGRFLRVVDSTPLPDGTRKRYWLRVPETIDTAHAAVAWTFGLSADTYAPQVET
jgi:hypothetical protein